MTETIIHMAAADIEVAGINAGLSRILTLMKDMSPHGVDCLLRALEVTAEAVKAKRAELVKANGGEVMLPTGDKLKEIVCFDKQPNPKKLIPLLNKKEIPVTDACFTQVEYYADPVKLKALVDSGRLTEADVMSCRRTWTQIRRISERATHDTGTDGDGAGGE